MTTLSRPNKGDPTHQAGVQELPGTSAYFPDPFIRLLPMPDQPIELLANVQPALVGQATMTAIDEQDIQQFPIDIQLASR